MGNSTGLLEERLGLVHRARAMNDRAEAEGRGLSNSEAEVFDRMMNRADQIRSKIDKEEVLSLRSRLRDSRSGVTASAKRAAYRHWLATGEMRDTLREDQETRGWREYRDTILSANSQGGYLAAPVEISQDITKSVNDSVWIRKFATVTPVKAAVKFGVRKITARMDDADWTSEITAAVNDTSETFGRRDLEPRLISKLAKASMRAVTVSVRPEESINDELTYKFSVSEEKAFLTGSGVGQPLGVFTADAAGITTARDVTAASATAIAGDDLINTIYSLREPHLNNPSLCWFVSREFVRRARLLKVASTTGGNDLEYVWQPGMTDGAPDRLLGVPYRLSEFAPATFATGQYVAVLGAWQHYHIAEVEGVLIQRLTERFSESNTVGFIGRRFVDGAPVMEEAFARLKMG